MLDDVSVDVLLAFQLFVFECGRFGALAEAQGCSLDACFVPKAFVDKALKQFRSTFHEEALNASSVEVRQYLLDAFVAVDDRRSAVVLEMKSGRKYAVAVDGEAKRVGPRPKSCGERRIVL